ncbi:MAG: ATP-binding protein, partial [Sphaerochaetaceae bacterium]
SSSIGSLTSYTKLANTFLGVGKVKVSVSTISNYLDFFRDAFLLNKADRYDIKGKKYMESPCKWYYTDLGLRNARLNFRQLEQTHIMENILYNELLVRGFSVDVGLVEVREKDAQTDKVVRSQLEVDFVANSGNVTSYIQSAFSIEGEGKKEKEIHSFLKINDSFKKVVIVRDNITPWYDDNGILFIGLEEFLLSDQLY